MPYVASASWYRQQYVMIKDGGIVTAYDGQTGAEVFQQRVAAPGRYYASPVADNGNLYFTSLDGEITLLQGGMRQPVVEARNPALGDQPLNNCTSSEGRIASEAPLLSDWKA